MGNYLAGLNGLEKIFLACAVFGGGFFILRTILMLTGFGDTDSDTDSGHIDDTSDHIEDLDHASHAAADAGLKILTVQGLTAFVMMFGLTGYAISRSSLLGSIMTIVVGILVGIFTMWLIAKGFALMKSMQSSGTMQVYEAMGREGTVYLTIPAEGIGKIQVTISGRLQVVDAVSLDKVQLKTGERICVSEIDSTGMLAVRKYAGEQ
ncbi:MAG: hypothetical protein JXA73_11145 [Acidobacteria bacterium]|nr:hypothetical protein [Acidobacteriota bacterium]